MTPQEELIRRAQSAAVSIREYIAGEWDGNIDGWEAVADHLEQGIERATNDATQNTEQLRGTS